MSLVSKELVDFVKSFEGFSATKYNDGTGVMTLGYGMTGEEIRGLDTVTEQQASDMLENLLNNKYAAPLKADLDSKNIILNQNQFDSLVSFAYNCGLSALFSSTLHKNIIAGIRDKDTITSNFQVWSMAGGQRLEGLYRRRTAEAEMFFGNGNTITNQPVQTIQDNIVKTLQHNLNRLFNTGLVEDGINGQCTTAAINKFGSILGDTDTVELLRNTNHVLGFPLTKQGDTGGAVGYVQYRVGADVDRIFGANTAFCVRQYQSNHNLVADGIVGQNTWSKLMA